MKSLIAIFCLIALFICSSSVHYVSWVEEKLHEQEVFAEIQEKHLSGAEKDANSSEEDKTKHQIKLSISKKSILPEGYQWEEEGREFSYKGVFYDIVSMEKIGSHWEIIAQSDEEETELVAQRNTNHKNQSSYKISKNQWVYIQPNPIEHINGAQLSIFTTLFHPPYFPKVDALMVSPPPDKILFS